MFSIREDHVLVTVAVHVAERYGTDGASVGRHGSIGKDAGAIVEVEASPRPSVHEDQVDVTISIDVGAISQADADRMGIPLVIIAGSNEFDEGTVSIKDLGEGKTQGAKAETRDTWVKERFGQVTVKRSEMISFLKKHLEPGS